MQKYNKHDVIEHDRAVWAMDLETIENLIGLLDEARTALQIMESKRRNYRKEFAILFKLTCERTDFATKEVLVISGISQDFKVGEV